MTTSKWVTGIHIAIAVLTVSCSIHTAQARILFQDDSLGDFLSQNLVLGANDNGLENTQLTFGSDPISANNGTIQWDITADRFQFDNDVSIAGDFTAAGDVDFSGSTQTRLREVASVASTACSDVNEVVLQTSNKLLYTCTVTGNPGTWIQSGGSSQDFEAVYATDTGDNLVTSNSPFTVTTGTSDFVVDSNDWNITAAGVLDAATITSNGLLSGLAGSSITGGTINFNAGSNFATNINTGSSTGQVSIGGGSNCVTVNSTSWDVSCAGVLTGLTGVTSSGPVNFSGGSTFSIPQFASDPVTCTPGQQYYNTTTVTVRLCTAIDTWGSSGAAGSNYVFAYDTTTQTVAVAGTFQNVTYNTNGLVNGWTHTAGSADFTASVGGTYMVNMTGRVAKSGGANTTLSFRGTVNGVEVPGSQSYGTIAGSTGDTLSGNFIINVSAGDILRIQMTAGTNLGQIVPGGNGTVRPSSQISIWRLN